ncbi:Polynucleotide 5'-hydroxyl-kinase grc3 [Coemansia sp. RSA 1722]|nr:Polynucleotide 5'-hydroxyl-kinase grc3 [Coemansia sp. RSA 1722]
MHSLWNQYVEKTSSEHNLGSAVVAIRSVSCGLEDIGSAAPAYRSIFRFDSFAKRASAIKQKSGNKRKFAAKPTGLTAKSKRHTAASKADSQEVSAVASGVDEDEIREYGDSGNDYDESMAIDADEDDSEKVIADAIQKCAETELALAKQIQLVNFNPVSFITPDLQLLQTPSEWTELLDQASRVRLQLDDNFDPISPIYVVAGMQGQGKSTFSRQLINRLISRFGRLFYMETDIGQSEISPPGALSLTMLSDPLLGPPFTHSSRQDFYHAVYMGMSSPKNDPDRYVRAVQCLTSVYRDFISADRIRYAVLESENQFLSGTEANESDKRVIPLVVNTQGWLRGLGLDMHYSLCEAVQPTNYIQLYDPSTYQSQLSQAVYGQYADANSSSDMVPFVDFSSITQKAPQLAWIPAMGSERASQVLFESQLSATNAHIGMGEDIEDNRGGTENESSSALDDMFEKTSGVTKAVAEIGSDYLNMKGPRLTSRDMRDLTIISHFYMDNKYAERQSSNANLRQLPQLHWDMHRPLAAHVPLVVPWSDLVFWLGEEDIPPSQLMRALNGTVVGIIAVASAPSSDAHTWTDAEIRALYTDGEGISDHAAKQLSEPGSRALLRSSMQRSGHNESVVAAAGASGAAGYVSKTGFPQIVYGHPDMNTTTFIAHALIRSFDPVEGNIHLVLPPLVSAMTTGSSKANESHVAGMPSNLLNRIVGIFKGPGPAATGIELPVWSMIHGGFASRAIGSSIERVAMAATEEAHGGKRRRSGTQFAEYIDTGMSLGVQEAPYFSVEVDGGIGASSKRSGGIVTRRALQK